MSAKAKTTRVSAAATKDVVYIDVDDEITAIIDKVVESPHKIVALVLPKRSTVLQSVVNMKLLKRSGDEAGKNVVLITSEAGLLPLAGSVGLYVAKTAQSKPVVPTTPAAPAEDVETIEEPEEAVSLAGAAIVGAAVVTADFDPADHAEQPIGQLAGIDDTIELDDLPDETVVTSTNKKTTKTKQGKNKKLKVPNFNKFRLWIVLGILGLILLIGGWILATVVLPKATIVIKTDGEDIQNTVDLRLDATATQVNVDEAIVPAIRVQSVKTTSQQVPATGTQNRGEKAEGSVVLTICASSPGQVSDIPAGTGVSTGGKTYITQERGNFSYSPGSGCGSSFRFRTQSVDIVAQTGGSDFNVSNATFSVAGNSNATGTGSASGGTDNIVKVVAQSDIDKAAEQLAAANDEAVVQELEDNLESQGLLVISESLNKTAPEVTSSAKAGDQADTVTVTQKVTYNMMGVKRTDLEQLVAGVVGEDIDTERQTILNTGIDTATFGLQNQQNDSQLVVVSMRVTTTVGPELDEQQIKESAAGKKGNSVRESLMEYPGVVDVEVTYSPFWVSAVPKNVDKITVKFEN